jgi:maltose-binding protein MalE
MRVILVVVLCISLLVGCSADKSNDLSKWNDEKVYSFLNEIQSYIWEMPVETDNKEKIVNLYEKYFSPDLSVKIVDSLYIESDSGWKIPDGDGGYIFIVPNKEQNEVLITINKDSIIVDEKYAPESWMYTKLQYTITYDKKPLITEWIMK